jgi:hypothetical protein
MQRWQTFAAAATFLLALTACAGQGAGSVAPGVPDGSADTNAATRAVSGGAPVAIAATSSIGAPLSALAEANADTAALPSGNGACRNGIAVFVPDRAGAPDSSEIRFFYDRACTKLARDAVRLYTPGAAGSETVTLSVSNYSLRAALVSTRATTAHFSNATFGKNGFPVAASGFVRQASSTLTVGASRRVIVGGSEVVVEPSSGNVNAFCGDSAAYNSIGVTSTGATFGWSGGTLSGGTRTANANGSVTWSGTHAGTVYQGPIGSIGLAIGIPNTSCPITTPAYTLTGGTVKNGSTSAISVTYLHGAVLDLTVARATLSGGFTLDVTTNTTLWRTSPQYITGIVEKNGTRVATLNVNAFGDGTCTAVASGEAYPVVDWIVIR